MGNEYILGILTLAGINLMTVLGLSLLTGFTGLFSELMYSQKMIFFELSILIFTFR